MDTSNAAASTPAPLPMGELKGTWLHRLSFSIHPDYRVEMGDVRHHIAVGVSVIRSPTNEGRQIHVGVKINPDVGKAISIYQAEMEAVVLLEGFPPDGDADAIDEHAVKVGGPIAVGAIREQLTALTGRTPFLKLMLPLFPLGLLLKAWNDSKVAGEKAKI